jgi:hypothetical protein
MENSPPKASTSQPGLQKKMKQICVSTRIPSSWHADIKKLMDATGQTQSEIIQEALGVYLKKRTPAKVAGRLDTMEASIASLRELVLQVASEVFETPNV